MPDKMLQVILPFILVNFVTKKNYSEISAYKKVLINISINFEVCIWVIILQLTAQK